jgi:hypothetical protein
MKTPFLKDIMKKFCNNWMSGKEIVRLNFQRMNQAADCGFDQ